MQGKAQVSFIILCSLSKNPARFRSFSLHANYHEAQFSEILISCLQSYILESQEVPGFLSMST
jgi:hypothetical protein